MKQALIAFARDVDAFCDRMNNGLGAVAIGLGILVAVLGFIRAEQYLPTLLDDAASDYQLMTEP